jgi:hypothetical protein
MRSACILVGVLAAVIAGSGCSSQPSANDDATVRNQMTTKVPVPADFLAKAKTAGQGPSAVPAPPKTMTNP